MGKLKLGLYLVITWLAVAPAQAASRCYQSSDLAFFQVVELVAAARDNELGCWLLRLRLESGPNKSGAVLCEGTTCDPRFELRMGIDWLEESPWNENIAHVIAVENERCNDVSFCIVPRDVSETMLIHFAAVFEESWFVQTATDQPVWADVLVDLSALVGSKSHCQDDDPPRRVTGSICL